MDDWSDYLVCLAVAEAGSLTAAAQQLGVSQPTVTRRLQALEQRFGEPVFDRDQGQSRLTTLGQKVVAHAKRMREEASAIERAVIAQDQSLSGLVVVSASEGLGADWLPRALASFQRANPQIGIEIAIKNHSANLADREADIALRWNGPGTQQSLIGRRGATVGAGLYASRDYLEEYGRPEKVEDLADHACVGWTVGDFFGWPSSVSGSAVVPKNISFKANSPASHLKGIEAGFGVGVTSHRLASKVSAGLNLRLRVAPGGATHVFLGPLAGWKPAAETRSVARVRDSESMQRAVWRKNPNTFYVAIEKNSCPLGKKRYPIGWKSTLSVPKGQSALISKD